MRIDLNPADPPPMLLRIDEVAHHLRYGRTKVYELIKSGEIPSIKIGGNTRVPMKALQKWIDRQLR
jgi:excisionase family DNA binding protein